MFCQKCGAAVNGKEDHMFISKKRIKALEARISELESKSTVNLWALGKVDFPTFAKHVETVLVKTKKPPAVTDGSAVDVKVTLDRKEIANAVHESLAGVSQV